MSPKKPNARGRKAHGIYIKCALVWRGSSETIFQSQDDSLVTAVNQYGAARVSCFAYAQEGRTACVSLLMGLKATKKVEKRGDDKLGKVKVLPK